MKSFCDCELDLFSLVLICCVTFSWDSRAELPALNENFTKEYLAWKADCDKVSASSEMSRRLESEHFVNIVKMGPAILPLVADRCIAETNFPWISVVWQVLTKTDLNPAVNPWATDSVRIWWEGGQELARERFLSQYREWKKVKLQGRTQEAEKYRKAIRSMGILALGPMMEQLDTDDEVLSMITEVIGDEVVDKGRDKQAIRSWWTVNKQKFELPHQSESKP